MPVIGIVVCVVIVVGIVLDIWFNGGPDNGADGWL
jgi:hypothetical protein